MLDPSLLELAGATLSGGVLTALLGLVKLKPERRKLEVEASSEAVQALRDALEAQSAELARLGGELHEARHEIARLVEANTRLEAEVRSLRGQLAALEH